MDAGEFSWTDDSKTVEVEVVLLFCFVCFFPVR